MKAIRDIYKSLASHVGHDGLRLSTASRGIELVCTACTTRVIHLDTPPDYSLLGRQDLDAEGLREHYRNNPHDNPCPRCSQPLRRNNAIQIDGQGRPVHPHCA